MTIFPARCCHRFWHLANFEELKHKYIKQILKMRLTCNAEPLWQNETLYLQCQAILASYESDLTPCVILGNRRSHKRRKILKILVYTFRFSRVPMELFYASPCALTEMLYKVHERCIRTGWGSMSSSLENLVPSILSGTHKSVAYFLNIADLQWC